MNFQKRNMNMRQKFTILISPGSVETKVRIGGN